MIKKLFVVVALVAAASCGKNPAAPSNNETPPPDTPTQGPSNTRVQIQKIKANEYRMFIWGNVKLGMEQQIYFSEADRQNSDSLSGGQIVIREYSCGGRSSFRSGYANSAPRENSDTTVFTSITTCGPAKLEMWVESFFHDEGIKDPRTGQVPPAIQHTMMSVTLHDSPGFRVDLASRSIMETGSAQTTAVSTNMDVEFDLRKMGDLDLEKPTWEVNVERGRGKIRKR